MEPKYTVEDLLILLGKVNGHGTFSAPSIRYDQPHQSDYGSGLDKSWRYYVRTTICGEGSPCIDAEGKDLPEALSSLVEAVLKERSRLLLLRQQQNDKAFEAFREFQKTHEIERKTTYHPYRD